MCNECILNKCNCGYTECESHKSIKCLDCLNIICDFCIYNPLYHQIEIHFCNDCYMNYRDS